MLTGCVQYKWVKPGVSDADMNKKLTECEAQALIDLPPDNVVTGSSSEKTDKKNKKKDISTSYTVEDANEYRRDTLVDSCMFKSGWDKIEVQ
jgi:flagellar motor protein MotB